MNLYLQYQANRCCAHGNAIEYTDESLSTINESFTKDNRYGVPCGPRRQRERSDLRKGVALWLEELEEIHWRLGPYWQLIAATTAEDS